MEDEITEVADGKLHVVVTPVGVEAFTIVTSPGPQDVIEAGCIAFTGNGLTVIDALAETVQPFV